MSVVQRGAAGLDHYRRLFGHFRGKLDRSSLPSPESYLTTHGLFDRRLRNGWASARCPVHKSGDEKHASMSINLADGHFKCHACGASGGDIVALHRLVTGLDFREAVRDLGGRFHD